MRVLSAVVVVFVLGCFSQALSAQDAKRPRPNVIIFLADDLGHADVGFQQRSKDVKTPNIDAIAANGVSLYAGVRLVSRVRAHARGVADRPVPAAFGFEQNPSPQTPPGYGLPSDQVLLARVLKDAGYATGMVGKWHLGFEPEQHPMSQGFDEFFGFLPWRARVPRRRPRQEQHPARSRAGGEGHVPDRRLRARGVGVRRQTRKGRAPVLPVRRVQRRAHADGRDAEVSRAVRQ
jgi:arylsulfatase A-like enzyme